MHKPPTGAFTSGLLTGVGRPSRRWIVSGLLCWRDSHPLEWQLASLNGVASFAAFATTFRSSNLTCPATQSGLYQPTCRLDLNGKPECSMVQVDPCAVQNYRELARDGDCAFRCLWCREPELVRWEGQCMRAVGEPRKRPLYLMCFGYGGD